MLWLFAVAAIAEPCPENPDRVIQLTEKSCECCYQLNDFIADNDYAYVLFYVNRGRLNMEINAKFEQMATDWRHSRVHFARIDVDQDREMSAPLVESNMVPTNVIFKFGRPVEVQPEDFEQIRDKYQGSPEGQKWLLTKYLGDDREGTNLHYSAPLMNSKVIAEFVENTEVTLVGYFDSPHALFLECVWKLYNRIDSDDIGLAIGHSTQKKVAKKRKAPVPSIEAYYDGKKAHVFEGPWTVADIQSFFEKFLPKAEL